MSWTADTAANADVSEEGTKRWTQEHPDAPHTRLNSERPVELVRTSGLSPRQVADDLRVDPGTIRRRLRRADIDADHRPGLVTDEQAGLARLRRENALFV